MAWRSFFGSVPHSGSVPKLLEKEPLRFAKRPLDKSVPEKTAALTLAPNEEKVLRFLTEHQEITRKETQVLLDVSQSTAGRVLKAMVDNGQIKQLGGSRTTRYELSKK